MSALLPKADIGTQTRDVRFGFACAEDHIGYQKTITFLDRELRSFVTHKRPAPNVRFGSKADIQQCLSDAALPPKADIETQPLNVRFVPKADILRSKL